MFWFNLFHFALIQSQNTMASPREIQIVGSDQRSKLMFAMQPRYQIKNHLASSPIQIAGWFIGQQNLWVGD